MVVGPGRTDADVMGDDAEMRRYGHYGKAPSVGRWRNYLMLGTAAAGGLLFVPRPPAVLGPEGTSLAGGIGLALATVALYRGSGVARVALVALAAVTGAMGGFAVWFLERYPSQGQLESAIVAVVPSGFRENVASRQDCDGWGCSASSNRSYVGPGSMPAVAERLAGSLRRAGYDDAVVKTTGPDSASVSGTCMSDSIAMGVKITQRGPDVVLEFGAVPR